MVWRRDGYEIYQLYLEDFMPEIERGEPVVLEVRDLQSLTRRVVKAQVARRLEDLPGSEKLWIRNLDDEPTDEYWAIKILEDMPDDAFKPRRVPKKKIEYRGGR